MNCPNCGASQIEICHGKQICKFCGTELDKEFGESNISTATVAYLKANKKALSAINSDISRSSKLRLDSPKSAEEIYENAIKGTASIDCYDLHCCGSGFLYNQNGYVITNAHVVMNDDGISSKKLSATINGIKSNAKVIACGNPDGADVALIQIERVDLSQRLLPIGNSDDVKIGAKVFAIGNSLGEGLCITTGIISDKNREVFNQQCFMSDVAINGGNSGGPLLNENGEVIAICVAGIDDAKGMNYFIPINDVLHLLKDQL